MELLDVAKLNVVTHPAHSNQKLILADVVASFAHKPLENLIDIALLALLRRLAQLLKDCSVVGVH